ncbi:MAG TPA: FecR domain-containing protein [Polyangiaceae bacterium]|nr:FecR domain-containing protein [Polyangiaceae bacterium]
MQTKTRTDELLRQLSTSVLPVEDVERAAARRDRVVSHLAGLVQSMPAHRQRRRRLFTWMATVSSAAAVALATGYVATRSRSASTEPRMETSAVLALTGRVQVLHRAAEVVATPLEKVTVGNADEVVTAEGARARAWLASGAEVDIDPQSRLRLSRDGTGADGSASTPESSNEAVVLGAGRVTVRVPKLGPRRTFAVETPEATVTVHGTAFSVERTVQQADAPSRTTVDVAEGSVAVRHAGIEILLHAGDHWSSGLPLPSEPRLEPAAASSDRLPSRLKPSPSAQRMGTGAGRSSPEVSSSDKSSSLAAENRLLQTAMAARQQGDARRAIQLAGELVTRFPASPLVEEARVERMRAFLSAGNAPAAAADARSYLSDYPQGFAWQEANRILAGPVR